MSVFVLKQEHHRMPDKMSDMSEHENKTVVAKACLYILVIAIFQFSSPGNHVQSTPQIQLL